MLKPLQYKPFTPKELEPSGWLKQQLEIQVKGLSGHLDKIWPDVRDSRWIGGNRDGWERVPYWLDGFIPLAYLLKDEDMQKRAGRYIDAILDHQQEDGWICPCKMEERAHYDVWPVFLICKVLTIYQDCTGDLRIQSAVQRALKQLLQHIQTYTLFGWGSARWFECLIPIYWLYDRTGEEWLLELAHKLDVLGLDYRKLFENWYDQLPVRRWSFLTHVVNLAMTLKSDALFSRMESRDPDAFADDMLEKLTAYHGTVLGLFSGDECLSGSSPVQGTELCGIVEAMYSFEQLLSISGNAEWADRLEMLAFNGLPAATSPDMWTHQYDQMTNQMQCAPLPENAVVFRTNGPEAHLFGLEPNFGCCTANFNQGWPKFALSAFMRTENGFASTVLAPSKLSTDIKGVSVTIELDTLYPFRDMLLYRVSTSQPVRFSLELRIPKTAQAAQVEGLNVPTGAFYSIDREWNGISVITVKLTQNPEIIRRPNDLVCVRRGALLFSLPIQEKWERVEYIADGVERKYPYCDYHVIPCSKWNLAFTSDQFVVSEQDDFDRPFSTEKPPISLEAEMAEIDWGFENGVCLATPRSRVPIGSSRKVKLIPYGCTNLRMTELPLLTDTADKR